MFLFIFFICGIALLIYGIKKYRASNRDVEDTPNITITTLVETYIDGVKQPPRTYSKKPKKLRLIKPNESYNRNNFITSFVEDWISKDYSQDENIFKKLPSKDQALNVFNLLEEENYLFEHIQSNNEEIVTLKFRSLYPEITNSELEKERLDAIDNFIDWWIDIELEDHDFKKKPTKAFCRHTFDELEKDGHSFKEISNNQEIVIAKFRHLYPQIMNTLLEKEIKEEIEFFLDDWSTWDGSLEDFRSKLTKKPTKKQLREVFYGLVNNGIKPTDVTYSDQKVYYKLIELFPELKK